MNLVIDIGNTRMKAAIFDGPEIIEIIHDTDGNNIVSLLEQKRYPDLKTCFISTVSDIPKNIKKLKKYISGEIRELNIGTPVPFINKYATYETLGKDRIAAVSACCRLFPGKNVLIIDAGTAITYDFKNACEEYLGGNISPGLTMRFKALHDHTSRLPLLNYSENTNPLGNSTEEAIRTGIQNGLLYEVNGYLDLFRNKYEDLVVVLTGGDAPFFDNKLKKPIFVISELTLMGLNFILEHAAKI